MAVVVPPSGSTKSLAFRLEPNDRLKESLCQIAQIFFARTPSDECSSLFVMTAVGSLKDVTLRLANASMVNDDIHTADGITMSNNPIRRWENQRFEIVSLVGTFSRDGSCHLHLSISDANGATFGGHLVEGIIFTTCEVVLGCIQGVDFPRELDERTGYRELRPRQILRDESWFPRYNIITKAAVWMALGYSLHIFFSKSVPGSRRKL